MAVVAAAGRSPWRRGRTRALLVFLILSLVAMAVDATGEQPLHVGLPSPEYEGLVLLQRYAAAAASCPACAKTLLAPLPPDLPTSRNIDVVKRLIETNGSAVVFDFEGPSLGIGNCLFGFLQAFHWAVLGGMPLFLLSHPKGTANALCSVFDCGFPIIEAELVTKLGSHRYPASPKDQHFRRLLSFREEGPFKVVCFRSHMGTAPCLSEAFRPPARAPHGPSTHPTGQGACPASRDATNSAVCWHAAALHALLPRLSAAAVDRLPSLRSHFHGDFDRVLALARLNTRFAPESFKKEGPLSGGGGGRGSSAGSFSALHVRTMNPKIESYGEMKGNTAATKFATNLEAFVQRSDFCTFRNDTVSVDREEATPHEVRFTNTLGTRSAPQGVISRDVFIASDSLLLKTLLRDRWETSGFGWRLHFFMTPGDRLTDVPRPVKGFSQRTISHGLSQKTSLGTNGDGSRRLRSHSKPAKFSHEGAIDAGAHGGTASQFLTLIEFWLLSLSRPLLAMAFFDLRLAIIDDLSGSPAIAREEAALKVAALKANGSSEAAHSLARPNKPHGSSAMDGTLGLQESGLRALSTFSKAASLLGGVESLESFGQCTSTGLGANPTPVTRAGPGACSSECGGRQTVFMP